jgi:hypothetical protein
MRLDVGGFHKAGLGSIQQQTKSHGAKPFPPTRLKTALDSPAFKVNSLHASWKLAHTLHQNQILV